MGKALFVTGTGTDIGKTYVTGLIVKKLKENGCNPAYYKAAMSGNDRDENGELIPGDALFVKNISKINQPLNLMCHYVYQNAYSPHLASRVEGNPVKMSVVQNGFYDVKSKYDYVTVEGSGGILCPICFDEEKIQMEDVIKQLGLSTIIIANAGLGTINDVVLTIHYINSKNIPVKGVIFNHYHKGDIIEEDNIKMCEYMTGVKIIAKVADGDKSLDIDIDLLKGLYD